ncbi:MAG: hypothetical protein HWN79_04895 [Candidatus Lokiarchaeota archaeon]|nr:hypothetical protein [Candidatus Lokiarchaeota archaeon]
MSNSEWNQVDFQTFIDKFSEKVIIDNAPTILYSKKDKEHEALNSLIMFFFLTGGLLIFISLSIFFEVVRFFVIVFIAIIVIAALVNSFLIFYYLRSHVPIRLLENWVEVYEGMTKADDVFYCFTYYPVFSGKCHPNKAKNVLYKLLQEELFNSSIDITQIEVYVRINLTDLKDYALIGYYFQYGEGLPFKSEKINRNSWTFFTKEQTTDENFIAVANWDHQYEWRNDLELDYDKLHSYAPWIIQEWDKLNLKPLTKIFKDRVKWDLRGIESVPKLRPWNSNFETTSFDSFKAYKDLQLMNDAIEKVIGKDRKIEKLKDIKKYILEFKAYLRDLKGQ